MQNDPGVCGVLLKEFTSAVQALRFFYRRGRRRARGRPNGQDVKAFSEDNRDLRRQTRKAEDVHAIRGRWSKRPWRTNPRHLFRYCDATLHVRDFGWAAVAEAVVRCMWPEKAQAMMEELRSTLLRARIRLDITSMLLRRRLFNSGRWCSQPRRSLHLQVDASPITDREVFCYGLGYVQWRLIRT